MMILSFKLFSKSKIISSTRKLFMKQRHKTIKHLRRHCFYNIFILAKAHLLWSYSCNTSLKDFISECFDFFLIMNSIIIINIFTFLFLVHSFSFFLSCSSILCRRWAHSTNRWSNSIKTILFNSLFNFWQLYSSIKRHVWHHDSNIFRSYKAIIIKIIHLKSKLNFLL